MERYICRNWNDVMEQRRTDSDTSVKSGIVEGWNGGTMQQWGTGFNALLEGGTMGRWDDGTKAGGGSS